MEAWHAEIMTELHYLVIERPDLNSHGHRRRLGRLKQLLRRGRELQYTTTTTTTNHEES